MKKRIIVIILSMILIVATAIAFPACSCSGRISFDKMTIQNFSNFKALGAAYVSESVKNSAYSVVSADETQKSGQTKLVGQKNDGTYEIVSFVDVDGKTQEQAIPLREIRSFNNFTYMKYGGQNDDGSDMRIMTSYFINYNSRNGDNSVAYDSTGYFYLVDNKTGKVFDANEMCVSIVGKYSDKLGVYARNYYECENYSYISLQLYHDPDNSFSDFGGIYKIEVKDGLLAVNKILDEEKFDDFFVTEKFLSDKYGNVFSENYMINAKSEINKITRTENDKLFRSMNNIVYLVNGSDVKCFNAEGVLIDSAFIPPTDLFFDDYAIDSKNRVPLVKTDGNSKYYYNGGKEVHKFTFSGGDEFEYEKITLEEILAESSPYVIANDKIYFLNEQEISYCEITTGKKTVLTVDYKFKTIALGYNGNVVVTAVDNSLNDVTAVIKPDDTLDIDIQKYVNKYDVVYVSPMN